MNLSIWVAMDTYTVMTYYMRCSKIYKNLNCQDIGYCILSVNEKSPPEYQGQNEHGL